MKQKVYLTEDALEKYKTLSNSSAVLQKLAEIEGTITLEMLDELIEANGFTVNPRTLFKERRVAGRIYVTGNIDVAKQYSAYRDMPVYSQSDDEIVYIDLGW